jgi:homeobox protein ESX1
MEKNDDETAIELKFIETSLKNITGVKSISFELTNWKKSSAGKWESASASSTTKPGKTVISGDGLHCPECDYVIRFCPCCGKPLSEISAHGKHRRSVPPIKPIIRKKRPIPPIKPKPVAPSKEILKKDPNPAPLPPVETESKDTVTTEIKDFSKLPFSDNNDIQPKAPAPLPELNLGTDEKKESPEDSIIPQTFGSETTTQEANEIKEEPKADDQIIEQTFDSPSTEKIAEPIDLNLQPEAPIAPAAPVDFGGIPAMDETPMQPAMPAQPEAPTAPAAPVDFGGIPAMDETPMQPAMPAQPEAPTAPAAPVDFGGIPAMDETPMQPAMPTQPEAPIAPAAPVDFGGIPAMGETPMPPAMPAQPEAPVAPAAPVDFGGIPAMDETPMPPAMPTQPEAPVAPAAPVDFGGIPAMDETPMPPAMPTQPEAPVAPAAPATPPALEGFPADDDTPLPPMKPAQPTAAGDDFDLNNFTLGSSPQTPAAPQQKPSNNDPFASLFSDNEADLGSLLTGQPTSSGNDPFNNLNLDLDSLEVISTDQDAPPPPPSPAPPSGAPTPSDPLNLDSVFDLDQPVPDNGSKKDSKNDPFALDDFDISKFKL